METVFDHNPTDEELKLVFGSQEKANRFRSEEHDRDTHLFFLAALMQIRNKPDQVKQCISRIEDREYRESVSQLWFGHLF